MDQSLLNQLFNNQPVAIAGIGILRLQHTTAHYQVAEREFTPPQMQLEFAPFDDVSELPDQQTIALVAKANEVSEEEAFDLWSQESEVNRNVLQSGKSIQLGALGKIALQHGQAVFVSAPNSFSYPAISAERVIRQDAVHAMKVGDTETDSRAMEEWLQTPGEETSRWWIWPLILIATAILLIVLGF